jgi:phage-related minor tail protein
MVPNTHLDVRLIVTATVAESVAACTGAVRMAASASAPETRSFFMTEL